MDVVEVGYHASHEQFPPAELLRFAQLAAQAGFDAILSSDHLAPWSERQGHSGSAYPWLGAVATTTRLPLGVVTAPGDRYHPAVLAQLLATVADLAPGRFVPALGSGQALNEHVTGRPWPGKEERNRRLAECAGVIRRLLAGETVDHDGLVTVQQARVYSLPELAPPLFAAALSPETAAEVASWADGLITMAAPAGQLRRVLDAFRSAGGDGKPVHVQAHLAWAESDERARALAAEHWRPNALPADQTEDLRTPRDFDRACRDVTAADLEESVLMSADLGRHRALLAELADLDVARAYLHHVGPDQARFIEVFGAEVLGGVRAGTRP